MVLGKGDGSGAFATARRVVSLGWRGVCVWGGLAPLLLCPPVGHALCWCVKLQPAAVNAWPVSALARLPGNTDSLSLARVASPQLPLTVDPEPLQWGLLFVQILIRSH